MKKLFVSCVALVLMASPVMAADTTAATPASTAVAAAKTAAKSGGMGDHKGVFEQADANNDGIVTKDEFLAAEGKYFDSVDTNHDGKLTKDEIQAQRHSMMEKRMQWRAEHDKSGASAPAAEQK